MVGFRNLVSFNQQTFVTDLQTDPIDFPTKGHPQVIKVDKIM